MSQDMRAVLGVLGLAAIVAIVLMMKPRRPEVVFALIANPDGTLVRFGQEPLIMVDPDMVRQ